MILVLFGAQKSTSTEAFCGTCVAYSAVQAAIRFITQSLARLYFCEFCCFEAAMIKIIFLTNLPHPEIFMVIFVHKNVMIKISMLEV